MKAPQGELDRKRGFTKVEIKCNISGLESGACGEKIGVINDWTLQVESGGPCKPSMTLLNWKMCWYLASTPDHKSNKKYIR